MVEMRKIYKKSKYLGTLAKYAKQSKLQGWNSQNFSRKFVRFFVNSDVFTTKWQFYTFF